MEIKSLYLSLDQIRDYLSVFESCSSEEKKHRHIMEILLMISECIESFTEDFDEYAKYFWDIVHKEEDEYMKSDEFKKLLEKINNN